MIKINWQSAESHLLLNPRLPVIKPSLWETGKMLINKFERHIWLNTSGSSQQKMVALSKDALLASAQAVNHHLQATSMDIWINPLPLFHVGGLAIQARGYLSGAAVSTFAAKWSVRHFYEMLLAKKGTLTALVPTQVYDLVVNKLPAPKSLRAVIVGGGALQGSLYTQARELGWPLLPSYGLTECSSQVATASLHSLSTSQFPPLEILPHVQVKTNEKGCFCLSSPALLTAYASFKAEEWQLIYPVAEGWLVTEDVGTLHHNLLKLKGRKGDFIKIGGENVEVGRLEEILEGIKLEQGIHTDMVLGAIPDERLGYAIHLFSTTPLVQSVQTLYDQRVLPFERIRKVHILQIIPRSPLKKLLRGELIRLASQSY
ncbi:putative o-succinylbenzoate-CoA ligase, menE [Neochlamydia sp. TUME1]|uniref:AMP-binding protein n=1 Tax=Neochlamydia sp. TUME1 TaxID=1478174 RepID=UPI00057C89B2|nr:AMP-binding protein [Neochlamydia sp. TUME1]KIC76267.1 putative o-succinylbenzoate-CoA ligase, menE [Neochlamydia sp. TUME1]